MSLNRKEVVLIGNSYSTLVLGLLLSQKNVDVEIYLENKQPPGLVFLAEEEYNLTTSYLHDVEGIVNYVLSPVGINIFDEVEMFTNIDEYILTSGARLIRRKGIESFANHLSSIFPTERAKIIQFFEVIINLGKENWLSIVKERISLKEIPYFLKYFTVEYKTFVESFKFKKELQEVLLSIAPWEGVSLVTMAGYWLQLDSVGRFKYGWGNFYEKLLRSANKKTNIFINVPTKLEENVDGWKIIFKDGKEIFTKVVVFSQGRWILQNFGIKIKPYVSTKRCFPYVYLVHLNENNFCPNVAYVRKVENMDIKTKVIYSYHNRSIAKVECTSETDQFFEQEKLVYDCSVINRFIPQQLQQITGIYSGNFYLWAHDVREIRNNPLSNLKVYDGIYCLGDWGNAYFFAAEFYAREILRYLGYNRNEC